MSCASTRCWSQSVRAHTHRSHHHRCLRLPPPTPPASALFPKNAGRTIVEPSRSSSCDLFEPSPSRFEPTPVHSFCVWTRRHRPTSMHAGRPPSRALHYLLPTRSVASRPPFSGNEPCFRITGVPAGTVRVIIAFQPKQLPPMITPAATLLCRDHDHIVPRPSRSSAACAAPALSTTRAIVPSRGGSIIASAGQIRHYLRHRLDHRRHPRASPQRPNSLLPSSAVNFTQAVSATVPSLHGFQSKPNTHH